MEEPSSSRPRSGRTSLIPQTPEQLAKAAAKKAAVSAAWSVTGYVGSGCLPVLGFVLFFLFMAVFVIGLVVMICQDGWFAEKALNLFGRFAGLGPICDMLKPS